MVDDRCMTHCHNSSLPLANALCIQVIHVLHHNQSKLDVIHLEQPRSCFLPLHYRFKRSKNMFILSHAKTSFHYFNLTLLVIFLTFSRKKPRIRPRLHSFTLLFISYLYNISSGSCQQNILNLPSMDYYGVNWRSYKIFSFFVLQCSGRTVAMLKSKSFRILVRRQGQ